MKLFLIFCLSLLGLSLKGQINILHLNANYIIDVWKPYSAEAQAYIESGKPVTSKTFPHLNAQLTVLQKDKFSFSLGVSYKRIEFRVQDKIETWYHEYVGSSGNVYEYYYYDDPADLVATSESYGLNTAFAFMTLQKEKIKSYAGFEFETYLREKYVSWYSSSDHETRVPETNVPYSNRTFLSSLSTNLFYKFFYTPKNYASIGLKLSAGANLYSEWDQFKKYAWVGVGLEIGLGRRKPIFTPEFKERLRQFHKKSVPAKPVKRE